MLEILNNQITAGLPISEQDAVELNQLAGAEIYELLTLAGRVTRQSFPENKVDL